MAAGTGGYIVTLRGRWRRLVRYNRARGTVCYSGAVNDIAGYADIHDNVRYWLARLTADVAASTSGERPIVVYDIGSNDGELSIPVALDAAGRNGRALQVVACEPLPAARARLINRATENGLSVAMWGAADVTVVPLAIGDRDEMIELAVYSDDTFSSWYERSADEQERYSLEVTGTVSVRMRPLDDLVAGETIPPPDIIKIDVEGAEQAVLAGAAQVLTTYRPPVVMEYSCVNTANAGYDRQVLFQQLQAAGYDRIYGLYRNTDRTLYGAAAFDDCRIWNVIALSPSDRSVTRLDISEEGPFHDLVRVGSDASVVPLIQRVDTCHLLVGEGKVEHVEVVANPILVYGFGNSDNTVLQLPPQGNVHR